MAGTTELLRRVLLLLLVFRFMLLSMSRLASVNICHSGSSEWGAIEAQHVPRLRRIVQEQFGVDIYNNKVAWFPDLDFLEQNGIPAMFGVQRAGDIVVLDGGCRRRLRWLVKNPQEVYAA